MAENYEFIICPACGKIMKKIYLEAHGFMVDVCLDGCGGIWLDNREYQKIDEKHEDITELIQAYEGLDFKKISDLEDVEDRECPICHVRMIKNHASAKQEVLIDECYNCGGKFLDYGELEKIRAEYENDEERTKAALDAFNEIKNNKFNYGSIDVEGMNYESGMNYDVDIDIENL